MTEFDNADLLRQHDYSVVDPTKFSSDVIFYTERTAEIGGGSVISTSNTPLVMDGSTRVLIEFFAPLAASNPGVPPPSSWKAILYEIHSVGGQTEVGTFGQFDEWVSSATRGIGRPVYLSRIYVPAKDITGWSISRQTLSGPGGSFSAGNGGTGNLLLIWLRISRT